MSEFRGFMCNGCGSILTAVQRTKVTIRYDGPKIQGETSEDLCQVCVEAKGIDQSSLKPIRRRGKKVEADIPTPMTGEAAAANEPINPADLSPV